MWATKTKESQRNPVTVVAGRTITATAQIDIFAGKTPVIFIPGIMGSTVTWGDGYPLLPEEYPAWSSFLTLYKPNVVGWKTLKDEFNKKCADYPIIEAPYDWRMPANNAVEWYLKPAIERAKQQTGSPKVNIVAHSTGGLITRAYIQGNSYDNDISKFAMVGTPNLGAVNAYYIWEGGDPKWADDLNDSGFGTWINFYWNTTEKLYEETYNKGDLKSDEYEKIWRFIHNFAPEAMDLLPTFNFLEYNGNLKWTP